MVISWPERKLLENGITLSQLRLSVGLVVVKLQSKWFARH